MKKIIIAVVLLSLTCALFANGGADKADSVELRIWNRNALMEGVVKMFNDQMEAEGKDVRAVFEVIPYDQQVPKFMAALSSNTAPDVYSLDLVQYPYFLEQDAFAPITKQYESLSFKDALPQGNIDVARKDGEVYALPYELDLSTLLVNMDILREAGYDKPPATWEEYIEIGMAVTKDTDGDGNIDQWGSHLLNSAGGNMFWGLPYLWGNGGAMIGPGEKVTYDSKATREVYQLWYDMVHTYKMAPESSIQSDFNAYNMFISGKLVMYHGGNFNLTSLRTDAPEIDYEIVPIPSNTGRHYTFGGGNLIGITSQSKDFDAAWGFIEYALSEEPLVEVYAKDYGLLPRTDLFDNKYYRELPRMMAFVDILPMAKTPISKNYNKIYDPLLYYINSSIRGELSVDEAVTQGARAIAEAMED